MEWLRQNHAEQQVRGNNDASDQQVRAGVSYVVQLPAFNRLHALCPAHTTRVESANIAWSGNLTLLGCLTCWYSKRSSHWITKHYVTGLSRDTTYWLEDRGWIPLHDSLHSGYVAHPASNPFKTTSPSIRCDTEVLHPSTIITQQHQVLLLKVFYSWVKSTGRNWTQLSIMAITCPFTTWTHHRLRFRVLQTKCWKYVTSCYHSGDNVEFGLLDCNL